MSNSISMGNALTTTGSGLGTGIDVTQMVDAQMSVLREPISLLQQQEATLTSEANDLNILNSELSEVQTDFESLTNIEGSLSGNTTSSSDSSIVTAGADTTATPGTHSIDVTQLATTSSWTSDDYQSASSTISDTSFTIQVGSSGTPTTIDVDSANGNNTLSSLASYINSQNLGVTANVISDANGYRLAIESQTSGTAGSITITNGSDGSGDLTFSSANTAQDALLTVDGISIDSSSNTVSTVIPGVTLNLENTGEAQVTVSPDTSSATTAINQFVSDYNQLITNINSEFSDSSSSSESDMPLSGDTNLQLVQEELLSDLGFSMGGNNGITSLASLGITMNDDGTLSVNSGTLDSALTTQWTAVQNFFQGGSGTFGGNFTTSLNNLTNPVSGPLYSQLSGITGTESDLTSQINDMDANLALQQTQLIDMYSTIDVTLEQLPLTLSELSDQLGSLSS